MQFEADVLNIVQGMDLGTREERNRIRAALDQFFTTQGYVAELGSFNKGTLMLFAAPAEHALLRYDMGALRKHLDDSGLAELVSEVKVRARPTTVPAAS